MQCWQKVANQINWFRLILFHAWKRSSLPSKIWVEKKNNNHLRVISSRVLYIALDKLISTMMSYDTRIIFSHSDYKLLLNGWSKRKKITYLGFFCQVLLVYKKEKSTCCCLPNYSLPWITSWRNFSVTKSLHFEKENIIILMDDCVLNFFSPI